ncbi:MULTISPECIES: arginyltransferase [Oceanimonas]|uniref:Aspartate/glutamate leucyltransferase n=1 Tax=Oceanimonas doudoroffii TaxID=84158 RepID=A0A233RI71_9GAMM|nr:MULTISPECIES: arginyltransferase [Oceanimonas]NHI00318.1 putative arginyl-tRNA--protein transferase [Oceanimonas sp. MB9]OXY83086.1 arginyltransferase [Oceanimonas doudoroffii]
MREVNLKVGLTPKHPCSYLPGRLEQLLVLLDRELLCPEGYEQLLSAGFRRSGSDIYRPRCQACQACESLRIPVSDFMPGRSQKRILRKNRDLDIRLSQQDKPEYFELYQRYISCRHQDGSMYPASHQQYDGFLLCQWLPPAFLEIHAGERLIAVAVIDILSHSLSAMYTFYDPKEERRSLGSFAILCQIQLAQKLNKQWLYLGYQVDGCRKMNYKQRFRPHERLVGGHWRAMKD